MFLGVERHQLQYNSTAYTVNGLCIVLGSKPENLREGTSETIALYSVTSF